MASVWKRPEARRDSSKPWRIKYRAEWAERKASDFLPAVDVAGRVAVFNKAHPMTLAQTEVFRYHAFMATVTETLRRTLEKCGQTRYAVSKATGIPESVLSRFIHGKPLRGENLDKLSDYLGTQLTPKPGGKPRKAR